MLFVYCYWMVAVNKVKLLVGLMFMEYSNMKSCFFALALLSLIPLLGCQPSASLTNTIDYVCDSSGVDPMLPCDVVTAYPDASIVNIVDGAVINSLTVNTETTARIWGGSVGSISSTGGYTHLLGGTIDGALVSSGSAEVTINSGNIQGSISAQEQSRVQITGGDFSGLSAKGITNKLTASEDGLIYVFGDSFLITNLDAVSCYFSGGYGEIFITGGECALTGNLVSGDPINVNFEVQDDASFIISYNPR